MTDKSVKQRCETCKSFGKTAIGRRQPGTKPNYRECTKVRFVKTAVREYRSPFDWCQDWTDASATS